MDIVIDGFAVVGFGFAATFTGLLWAGIAVQRRKRRAARRG